MNERKWITELSARGYLKELLLREYPEDTVEKMMQKTMGYAPEEIERVANAIERFGAKALIEAI